MPEIGVLFASLEPRPIVRAILHGGGRVIEALDTDKSNLFLPMNPLDE